jgi:Arc/MetJ-type ribon-helix-helix transcriptional regulator
MSKKVSITLDHEVLDFVDRLTGNRSSYINSVLREEKRRIFMKELEDAYKDQASDLDFQEEISVWNIAVGDGLNGFSLAFKAV